MNYQLRLTIQPAEGALLRTLGLIQRRGFGLLSLTMDEVVDGMHCVRMRVASVVRPVDVLARQLMRLHEVQAVIVEQCKHNFLDHGAAVASTATEDVEGWLAAAPKQTLAKSAGPVREKVS